MGTEGTFDVEAFEKRLKNLKDTQEGIQGLSAWCLLNHVHHKKIVTAWLQVLKQGKICFGCLARERLSGNFCVCVFFSSSLL